MYNNNDPYAEPVPSFQQPVPPPDIDPDTGWLLQAMYSIEWIQVLAGALTQLLQSTTWDTDTEDDRMLAQNRAMLLMNILLGSSVSVQGITNTQTTVYRYDADSDQVQVSFDGGTTAQDAPGADPRHQTTFPPNTGTSQPCDAAGSYVTWLENFIGTATTIIGTGSDATSLAAFMLGLLVDLGPFGIILDIITAVALGLVSLGADVINLNMTPGVYHRLQCILFENMDSSGQLSQTALATVESQVSSEIGGVAADIINPILSMMGEGGINNAASTQHATGDCTDCEGWCYQFDFTESDGGWEAVTLNGLTAAYVPGQGWWVTGGTLAPGVSNIATIHLAISADNITSFQVFANTAGRNGTTTAFASNVGDATLGIQYSAEADTAACDLAISEPVTDLWARAQADAPNPSTVATGSAWVSKVVLRGTGDNPFGTDNC